MTLCHVHVLNGPGLRVLDAKLEFQAPAQSVKWVQLFFSSSAVKRPAELLCTTGVGGMVT